MKFRELISLFTLPGVIFHELGHQLFCYLTGVKVLRVCYFRFGNPSGYVIHERPARFYQSFFIAVGPFITGALFAALFYFLTEKYSWQEWEKYLFLWLGFSVAVNSFPGDTDASVLWKAANRHVFKNLLAIVGYPVALIIWLANYLRFICFDLVYAGVLYYLVVIMLK